MAQALNNDKKELTLQEVIVKVTNMVSYDSKAQKLAKAVGLNINYVSWEDCARNMGSCWGPCISDMTLQVNNSCMPVMREPNYTDKTWDVATDKIPMVIGNHTLNTEETLQAISLKDYLLNFSDFMSNDIYSKQNKKINLLRDNNRDSHVIMSSQTCFLPIQRGKETKFNVALYNYQSRVRNPAVLVIISTSKGSSAQIIEGTTQYLLFNNNGKMADFVGERVSDVRLQKEGADKQDKETIFDKKLTKEEKKDNVIVIVQVPLKQKPIKRRKHKKYKNKKKKGKKNKKKKKKKAMDSSDDEEENVEAAIIKIADRTIKCICGQKLDKIQVSNAYDGNGLVCNQCDKNIDDKQEFVYHCKDTKHSMHSDGYDLCIKCGDKQIQFDELRGMMEDDKDYVIKRNTDFPIRVTLQYYKATDNGVVSKQIMDDIVAELKTSQKQADFIGSLVTEYKPNRPTDWINNNYFDDEKKDDNNNNVDDGYKKIRNALKEYSGTDWNDYMKNFKKEQVMDKDLKGLSVDDLKELIPKMGPRNRFKNWLETNK